MSVAKAKSLGRVCSRKPDAIPQQPVIDHGPDGPAQTARPSRLVETITAGVRYREMRSGHPIDHWADGCLLTERQIDAAWKLARAFQTGFPARPITPAYGAVRGGVSGVDAEIAQTEARRDYAKWMDKIPHECRHAMARVVRGEFPDMLGGLRMVRIATDALADSMKLPRVTVGGRDES